jgi:Fe-S-cluster containining protein
MKNLEPFRPDEAITYFYSDIERQKAQVREMYEVEAHPEQIAERGLLVLKENSNRRSKYRKIITLVEQGLSRFDGAGCSAGCSHCCHIPVVVTEFEAIEIGERIGRAPDLAKGQTGGAVNEAYNRVPCIFLQSGICSIYEARPATCRTYLSLAKDGRLCEANLWHGVPMIAIDGSSVRSVLEGLNSSNRRADIRDYFA